MIPSWENHFGKRTAWSLIHFLNYAYFDMQLIRKFWETPSTTALGILIFVTDVIIKFGSLKSIGRTYMQELRTVMNFHRTRSD